MLSGSRCRWKIPRICCEADERNKGEEGGEKEGTPDCCVGVAVVYVSSHLNELGVDILGLILHRMSGLRLPVHVHDATLAVRLGLQPMIRQQCGKVMLVAVASVVSA